MFHVASMSRWHPHESRYTPELLQAPDCEVTCVWDEDAERGKAWAKEIGVPFAADYREVLANPAIDGVCITAPTTMHKEIILAAARAGKHIFTEKTMALTRKDAEEMREAIRKNGVTFGIAYIRRTTGAFMFVRRLLDQGTLGDITMVRIRNGHNGAVNGMLPDYWLDGITTGGGAMTDLGCHQIYLAEWLLGMPDTVSSTYGFYKKAPTEDSSVAVMSYRNGRTLAILDCTFTSYYTPYFMEVYGTEGMAFARLDGQGVEVHMPDRKQAWFEDAYAGHVTKQLHGQDAAYVVAACALPDEPSPLRQWVDACVQGKPMPFDIDSAVRMAALIEAANRSWAEKRQVSISEIG